MKYLLTPITMFLWFLITYYGLYFAFLAMVYTFSLNWGILIFGYLFLIGVLYGIFISLPSLLRYLIQKFYGLNWFTTLTHWLSGVVGVILLIIYFTNNSQAFINENNNTFFLVWMWGASPLKTIFLIIPFFALSIGLLWSTIILPIQIQLSTDVAENNKNENKNIEMLIYRAEELVDSSRVLFAVIRPRLLKKFPEIFMSNDLEKINIYGTIACSYLVCIHLHYEVEKECRTELELIVQKNISEIYENAFNYYEDLHSVIQRKVLEEKDRSKRRKHLHYIACLWILHQIGLVKNIDQPYEKAIEIAHELSEILENETAGYWSMN